MLVHCVGGVSRSATLCIAYLMSSKTLSLRDAYEFVRKKRPTIAPNINFMGQLLQHEEQLLQHRSAAASNPLECVAHASEPVALTDLEKFLAKQQV